MLSPPTWARGIDEDILAEGSPAEEAAAADAAAASLAAAARETAAVLEARLAGQEGQLTVLEIGTGPFALLALIAARAG